MSDNPSSGQEQITVIDSQKTPLLLTLVLLIILLVLYFPYLNGSTSFFLGDHNAFQEPTVRFMAEAGRQARLPLWNPYFGCGEPQLAAPAPGMFYPPNWLFIFLPYSVSLGWLLVMHQLIGATGSYLLLEKLGCGRAAATAAAAIFALNGFMFSISAIFTIVFTGAWGPFCVWAALVARSPDKNQAMRGCAALAILTALLILSGRPEIYLLIILITLSVILSTRFSFSKDYFSSLTPALLAFISGGLLSMPQLAPLIEWLPLSSRSSISYEEAQWYSASWSTFLSILMSDPLGSVYDLANPYAGLLHVGKNLMPFVSSIFVGSAAIALAGLGGTARNRKLYWLLILGACIMLLVCAGNNTRVVDLLLNAFPFLSFQRYPSKLLYFFCWAVSLLCGLGVSSIYQHPKETKKRCLELIGIWSIPFAISLAMAVYPGLSWFGFLEFIESFTAGAASQAMRSLGVYGIYSCGLALLVLAAVLALVNSADGPSKSRTAVATICQTAIGLALLAPLIANAHTCTILGTAPTFFTHPSYGADVIWKSFNAGDTTGQSSHLPPRIYEACPLNSGMPGVYKTGASTTVTDLELYSRQLLENDIGTDYGIGNFTTYPGQCDIASSVHFNEAIKGRNSQFNPKTSDLILARVLQMACVQYAISQIASDNEHHLPMLNPSLFQLVAEAAPLNIRIYKTIDPLPFAYFINRWYWSKNEVQEIKTYLNVDRNSYDPHNAVILRNDNPSAHRALGDCPSDRKLQFVTITDIQIPRPERIELQVEAPGDGVVVVNDSFYPGWHATVDGNPVPVAKANVQFKAVPVPAGKHKVILLYQPASLLIGVALAVCGLLLLAVALSLIARSKEVRTPTPATEGGADCTPAA